MFWEDIQETGRNQRARVMPPIPDTGWTPPRDFPNLAAAKVISFDTETFDPDLMTKGPGWARGVGHMIGLSVGTEDGGRWYFPFRHEVEGEMNLDANNVLAWARDTLGNPRQPKVGANLLYDVGWLRHEGVLVKGPLYDVQFAEALLNESAQVNLELLANRYLGEGKETNDLYQWLADYYGGKVDGKQRANLYRSPPRLAGPYAEADADLPLRILPLQWAKLHAEGLLDVFDRECRLIPLLIEMRFAGVRIDIDKAEPLKDQLLEKERELQGQLNYLAGGTHVNVNSSDNIGRLFDQLGLAYPRTKPSKTKPNGSPSFTKEFLSTQDHDAANLIRSIRQATKLRTTFIESYILNSHIGGKVFCQFHPLRGEENGTRSGRFSSSTPNLQNIPSRDDVLAPLIRGLFVPDYGHRRWRRYDYSQIEYRFLAHFAVGELADAVRDIFNTDPHADYHDVTLDMVAPVVGWDVSDPKIRKAKRKPIKNINFGLIYGMGIDKLANSLGLSLQEGRALFAAYHRAAPFAKATMDECSEIASRTGVITTIWGRRSRFELWEPVRSARGAERKPGLPLHLAATYYGPNIRRAYTHKALNRRLQGSAADMMKEAMLRAYEDGVFDTVGVPRLTVHDELDFSDTGYTDEAFNELQHILETCMPLRVPVRAEAEVGPDWGHVEDLRKAA